jgi:LysM repeat protein
MSAQDAVTAWMGDAPHQYTMLSPDLTEIGAGVAIAGGLAYYVIDCAQPTISGAPPVASTQVFESGTVVPANEAVIYPVALSTPNLDGDVFHEVQPGQTLWQIAIVYAVKIDDIKRLNDLFDNNIYPGDKLLIKKDIVLTLEPATETATPEVTTVVVSSATLPVTLTTTATRMPAIPAAQNNNTLLISVILIIVLAILGGGYFTWLGSSGKQNDS